MIETERLILRKAELTDAPFFYELNSNPLVVKYTGDSAFKDLQGAENIVHFLQSQYAKNGYARLTVIEKSLQLPIGWCGLKFHEDTNETDIGYRFMQKYWNKGYATESAKACLEYGFNKLNLNRIVGNAMKENPASIAVFKKLGMTYFADELLHDEPSVIYEIKKEQF